MKIYDMIYKADISDAKFCILVGFEMAVYSLSLTLVYYLIAG